MFMLGLAVAGGTAYYFGLLTNTVEYTSEIEEKFIDNTPDEFKDCPECMEAAQNALRKKELEAELSQLESEVAERQARIEEIEKELGTY